MTKAPNFDLESNILTRIADALERLAPQPPQAPRDFASADAFVWHPTGRRLVAVKRVNRVDMGLLKGIDRMRDILVENTANASPWRPTCQQCPAVGRARDGQIIAGQGGACEHQRTARRARRFAQAHRDPSGRHRKPARFDGAGARRPLPGSSCSATTCRSMPKIRPTSR